MLRKYIRGHVEMPHSNDKHETINSTKGTKRKLKKIYFFLKKKIFRTSNI